MNRASGGDGIPAELFQILKDMLLKCCTQYTRKFGNFSYGHKTGKDNFHSNAKEGQCQKTFKLLNDCAHSHATKDTLRNYQARLQ